MKRQYRKNDHVMLDVETLGKRQCALVISIGAVIFDPYTGEINPHKFYTNIDWQSGIDAGREVDVDTIKWWLTQSEEARTALTKGKGIPWDEALDALKKYIPKYSYVWSNGATFDISIFENAYQASKHKQPPWSFRSARDVRTLSHLAEEYETKVTRDKDDEHNAASDALYQAQYVIEMWQFIKGNAAFWKQAQEDATAIDINIPTIGVKATDQ